MVDLLHTLTCGQSLSIGGGGTPALSTVSEEPNARVVAATGQPFALQSATAQRPDLSMGYYLARRRPSQMLGFSTHGQGGQSIASLSPGGASGRFEEAVDRVQAAASYAVAHSSTYALEPVLHWIQGEQDSKENTPAGTYIAASQSLRAAYIDAIEPITGQDLSGLAWIMSQTASWAHSENGGTPRIGLTQLEMARTLPHFYLVGGQYQLSYGDTQHPTAAGYYALGELHGRAHQAILHGDGWQPFAPTAYTLTPTHIDVTYHVPAGALEWDTTTVPAQPAMGFSLHSTASAITAVTLVGSDRVRLGLSQPIVEAGVQVGYGVASSIGGVGVGNLTDGETYVSNYDGARLANWAVHSRDTISTAAPSIINATAFYLVGPGGKFYPITG